MDSLTLHRYVKISTRAMTLTMPGAGWWRLKTPSTGAVAAVGHWAELSRIRALCKDAGLALHLDGARLFNALVARGESPPQHGSLFDTISICLSKGLGAPAGSLLLGSRAHIARAHRYRKAMGGGMRQAGYLAAAGLYALDHHVERLAEDHAKARAVGEALAAQPYVEHLYPVETNIVVFKLRPPVSAQAYLAYLQDHDVRALSFDSQTVRFVFHLDVSGTAVDKLLTVIGGFPQR